MIDMDFYARTGGAERFGDDVAANLILEKESERGEPLGVTPRGARIGWRFRSPPTGRHNPSLVLLSFLRLET